MKLIAVECFCEININFYLSEMWIYSLAALKNYSKKKEMEKEKDKVDVFKHVGDRRKKEEK